MWKDVDDWWAFGRSQNLAKMEPDKIMTNIIVTPSSAFIIRTPILARSSKITGQL